MAVTSRSKSIPARRPSTRRVLKTMPTMGRFVTLCLLCALFAFPFYWVILTSLVPSDHVYDFPPSLLPMWHFQNYADAWAAANWVKYFFNPLSIAGATTIL